MSATFNEEYVPKLQTSLNCKLPRRKTYSAAFWESLVRLGVQPAEVAPTLRHWSESEVAEEMTRARLRLDEQARDRRERRRLLTDDADLPAHLRERSASCIPQARPGR